MCIVDNQYPDMRQSIELGSQSNEGTINHRSRSCRSAARRVVAAAANVGGGGDARLYSGVDGCKSKVKPR